MIINMPVEVLGEYCANCPDLDIDVFTKEEYKLSSVADGETELNNMMITNILKCKYCNRCKGIFLNRDDWDKIAKEAEKKVVKRTAKTKKPAVKVNISTKTTKAKKSAQ
jgi:Zn-finger nucleic acid-binding protein